jgi:hypothetical protein
MQRDDYFERMVQQIAAIVARALGLATHGQFEDAQRELDGAWTSVVGLRRSDVMRLDATTLRSLLGTKVAAAAQLLDAQAELDETRGESGARARAVAAALRR